MQPLFKLSIIIKKMKRLFLLVLLIMSTIIAKATDFTYTYQGQTLKYTILSDSTVSVQKYDYLFGAVEIP